MTPVEKQEAERQARHAVVKEEFYLLCMLRFGMVKDSMDVKSEDFFDFRKEIHPDYFGNEMVPVLDRVGFTIWCRGKRFGNKEESNG